MEIPKKEKFADKETSAQKTAALTLQKVLEKFGISVQDQYIGMEDFKDGTLHVRLAHLEVEEEKIAFSFDADKDNRISSLKVQTISGVIPVNESFELRELPVKVSQIFKRAQFEKQKEDQFKKGLK